MSKKNVLSRQLKLKSPEEQNERFHSITQEQWDFAHLQLNNVPAHLPNPLLDIEAGDFRSASEEILSVMMNPDYFGWTCTKLFNTAVSPNGLELLPFQCSILKELWYRPFPILLGTRGMSKSFLLALYSLLRALFIPGRKIIITGAGFRQSKLVLAYAEQLWNNSPVFRDICGASKDREQGIHHSTDVHWMQIGDSTIKALPIGDGCISFGTNVLRQNSFSTIEKNTNNTVWGNGCFRSVDEFIDNGKQKTKNIRTDKGFSFNATYNHGMKICRNGKIDWVRTDEMVVGDRILIDRSYRWHEGQSDISLDEAYALGALTGDGSWTQKGTISLATYDSEIAEHTTRGMGKEAKPDNIKKNYMWYGIDFYNEFLKKWNLPVLYTIDKYISDRILSSPRHIMTSFIQGLMDTDGSIFKNGATYGKEGNSYRITFTNTSEKLIDQLHFILLHYGIVAKKTTTPQKHENWNIRYDLIMHGTNAKKFAKEIGFRLKRKADKLPLLLEGNGNDIENIPFIQEDMLDIASKNPVPRFTRKHKKVALSNIKRKHNIDSAFAHRFLETYEFTNDARLEQIRILSNPDIFYDTIVSIEDSEVETYDIHVPEGHEYCANGFFSHNSKIRGQRTHDTICDEFSSVSPLVFEEVIAGFGVVNIDPISQVKHFQRMEYLKDIEALPEQTTSSNIIMSNQMILSGTASFAYNHFCKYWKDNKNIILSQGDPKRMQQLGIEPKLDYRKYSVIRIPVQLLPKGFMDQAQVDRAEASLSVGVYSNEYGAVFTDDSNGFYKNSILVKAMSSPHNPVAMSDGTTVDGFPALLHGDPNKKYIMAIDPASQRDNFAIIILEYHNTHSRIVHCWTTNAQAHLELREAGIVTEKEFYDYTHRKIRSFMKAFNIIHICIDSQGGGRTIAGLLHNDKALEHGEELVWEIDSSSPLWDGKERDTDVEKGRHIIEFVNFADGKYTTDANHDMKADFEHRILLFPFYDDIEYILAGKADSDAKRHVDTLEDVYHEIEQLRDELMMISVTTTPSGREHWGAPKVKGTSQVSSIHDDRFSALLMANAAARRLRLKPVQNEVYVGGGFVGQIRKETQKMTKSSELYVGPAWFTEHANRSASYGMVVNKDGD